ncbi:hypothetical protein [Parvimonas parva]|uniref:hypothetical protein n=1 Tax=Parvimonas parva TaxID=2769485 RepID=UPI0038B40506
MNLRFLCKIIFISSWKYDIITVYNKKRLDKLKEGDYNAQDKTRQDKTRQDKTRQDKTRQDKTRQDKTRL